MAIWDSTVYIFNFFCYYFSKLTEGGSPVLIVNADQNLLGIIITKRAQETALRHFVERHLAVASHPCRG
jgi:hypothetical protein